MVPDCDLWVWARGARGGGGGRNFRATASGQQGWRQSLECRRVRSDPVAWRPYMGRCAHSIPGIWFFYALERFIYSFLLISNKFCDLNLLHWPLFTVQGGIGMWGGGAVR